MRALAIAALAALAMPLAVTAASASDEVVTFSAPLYREMARDTQRARPVADMRTVPQPVYSGGIAPARAEEVEVVASVVR